MGEGPLGAGVLKHLLRTGVLEDLLGAGVRKHPGLSPTGESRFLRRFQNSHQCYTPAAAFPLASTTPCHPARASRAHPPTASPPAPLRPAAALLPMLQQVGAPRTAWVENR